MILYNRLRACCCVRESQPNTISGRLAHAIVRVNLNRNDQFPPPKFFDGRKISWACYLAEVTGNKLLNPTSFRTVACYLRPRSVAGSARSIRYTLSAQTKTVVLLLRITLLILLLNAGGIAATQRSSGPVKGTLVVDGGGTIGSYTVRGCPDKPLLMAAGHERGFAFMKNVAINPHLTQAKRDNELINVVDAHPILLGIGIDEDAALIVEGNRFEVIGTGRVAIYDNQQRDGSWYYWLKSGERFDLSTWKKNQ
jgi:hypothetical protein